MAFLINMLTDNQIKAALRLAEELHQPAVKNDFTARMEPILKSPDSKFFLIRLMDVAFRSKNASRISNYVLKLFRREDTGNGLFNGFETFLIKVYESIGRFFPGISIPLMLKQVKSVTSPILFFVGDRRFNKHAASRKEQGVRLNVNLIGEALIGEQEAAERIKSYKSLLRQPDVNYISIKISTIYSQISSLAYEHTVETLVEKLSQIYDELIAIEKETGERKFVNLDMEEYRDLHLTIATFTQTLSLEKYKNLYVGIVLQAYLPDSYNELVGLTKWAENRVKKGGSPIKIRLVKGANMEMEKTESSLEDWPVAPYSTKAETDANYKKMMLHLLQKEHLKFVHAGIASHNIFDLALGLSIVQEHKLGSEVDFEMLEGMANETVDQLLAQKANVLLYTPIVKPENYNSAIAYLVRRLDEGTQAGNFLREGFDLQVNSQKWEELKQQFLEAVALIPKVSSSPNRNQNRATEKVKAQEFFSNVSNTDWNLQANREWLATVKKKWEKPEQCLPQIKVLGNITPKKRKEIEISGWNGSNAWLYELAGVEDYQEFIEQPSDWHLKSTAERAGLLRAAAVKMEENRGDLIAVAVTELGKTVAEVDVEVSEAIDFANYYAQCILEYEEEFVAEPKSGINLVLSPWNFPVAIPIGGVLASLAAGKRVILKPSTNAAATAFLTSKCLYEAGIPDSAFAFLPAEEISLDPFLAEGEVFDAVILTGGTETARFLLERNPSLRLYAETGGKNSTIVTALSDRDQAIKNVIWSAFGNAGQKCSATSLLILEEEVFNDEHFKSLQKDAAESKYHGNPWNLETVIGPLAVPVSEKLRKVIEETPEHRWLLKPNLEGEFMLSPGILWGLEKTDFAYENELFGPILGVMKAKNLEEAVELANGVEYGLTSGLESLDPDEVAYWKQHMMAGNLYVNRSTTGAIVQRQPFGGIKASSFGFGMKAGGKNYVLQFMQPESGEKDLKKAANSYKKWAEELFNLEIDYANLRGQDNFNRYLKPDLVYILVDELVNENHIYMTEEACKALKLNYKVITQLDHAVDLAHCQRVEEWSHLLAELDNSVKVRALNRDRLPLEFVKGCHKKGIHLYGGEVSENGRLELLNYLNEQNFSYNYHRYGNLMGRHSAE